MTRKLFSTLAVLSLSLWMTTALAAPVVWDLSGTFQDGGTASGSFTYDADTSTYSAISIDTTAGSTITTGNSYDITKAEIGCATSTVVCLLDSFDGPDYTLNLLLNLAWSTSLTNAGGTISIAVAREYTCVNSDCSRGQAPTRSLDAGSITANPAAPTYSVGGSVTGLTGTGLALQNNGGDTLAVAAAATAFTFSTELLDLAAYDVTVSTQPTGQTCSVTNGSGAIAAADVTDVVVDCVDNVIPTYSVGGAVSGLTGTGLALQNNGGDTLAVAAAATAFTRSEEHI